MPIDQSTLMRVLVADRTRLLAYIWAIVRDEDVAEDVYQEMAISAVTKVGQINDEDHLNRWLRQAARYRSLDALRRRSAEPLVFDDAVLDALEADWDRRTHDAMRLRSALRECIASLSPYAQKLLTMRYEQDLTGEHLASAASRSINTVYTALARAHRALALCVRQRLAKGGTSDV
ncbi:MAG: sigma-70 family RNA polymerase sigma factor [Planctomycetes bacterium]|nr:sigma-70 family RNA polymerase sigma factor [Planctomycetota bacterium]